MKRCLSSIALVALVLLPASLSAQDTDWNRYTLEGLGGVFVTVEADDVCEGAGVMASTFEASTSLALIEGEVGVLTQAEMLEHPAHPELEVSLECAGGSGGSMAYVVNVRVHQAAQMLRDTQITLPEAVTWYTAEIGVTSAAAAPDALGSAVEDALGTFISAWGAAHTEEGAR